jgi:galactokinase
VRAAQGAAAARWFRDCYGSDPAGVWHAPGRVNLIGEHTDYNEGYVLPFALAQGVRAAAGRRDDGVLELCSRQAPGAPVRVEVGSLTPGGVPEDAAPADLLRLTPGAVPEDAAPADLLRLTPGAVPEDAAPADLLRLTPGAVPEDAAPADLLRLTPGTVPEDAAPADLLRLTPGAVPGWAGYAAGVAWSLREAGYAVGGARVAIDADLPQGAGLASSAALECAIAVALTGLYRVAIAPSELARLARRAENDFVGVPTGIMDQSASLECTRGHALLLDCRSLATAQVPLDLAAAGAELLVLDTRARHEHAGGSYTSRRRACEQAAALLGVPALRDVTDLVQLDRLPDPVLRRRARHVVADNQRVLEVTGLLRSGDVAEVGPLLTESHRSLRDDFEISWPQADVAVDAATAAGALGARMMGGGFGGSVIVLVPAGRAARVVAAVGAEYGRRNWPAPALVPAAAEAGAYLMT